MARPRTTPSTTRRAASDAPGTPAVRPTDGRELRARGRNTMARLLEAGMKVLAERGYHAARVDDIVRAARTSHGTFYLYFSGKEDLVAALARDCAVEMTRLAGELGPVEPSPAGRDHLLEWLERFLRAYERSQPVVRAWVEEQVPDRRLLELGTEAFAEIVTSLAARIAESPARPAGDPQLAAAAMLAMIERLFYFVSSRDLGFEEGALLGGLATLLHRGFFGGGAPVPAAARARVRGR